MSQKWESYSTEVPGKWVLSGEHTVLRGGMAIALPHPEFKLRFEFHPDGTTSIPSLIQELLEIAKKWLSSRGLSLEFPKGRLTIETTIPIGAGLGSSAALSVATARWVLSAYGLDQALERELAREMENYFHGKSSGMDVAVVSLGEPILFSMKEGAVRLGLSRLPEFTFIDTGLRSATKDCIDAVEKFRAENPKRGEFLDAEMRLATSEVLDGLRAYDQAFTHKDTEALSRALAWVAAGMDRSRGVFEEWGLIPEEISSELTHWRLTGSGRGGFLVGLT